MHRPSNLTINTIVKQSDKIIAQHLDEDIVMANINTGNYYGVSLTSKRIWELIEKPISISDICSTLTMEYTVDRSTCEESVLRFIDKLFQADLIDISN